LSNSSSSANVARSSLRPASFSRRFSSSAFLISRLVALHSAAFRELRAMTESHFFLFSSNSLSPPILVFAVLPLNFPILLRLFFYFLSLPASWHLQPPLFSFSAPRTFFLELPQPFSSSARRWGQCCLFDLSLMPLLKIKRIL
jgi:hypothetical protein